MYMIEILKPINEESIANLMLHPDDRQEILECAEEESIEYIRFDLLDKLAKHGYLKIKRTDS